MATAVTVGADDEHRRNNLLDFRLSRIRRDPVPHVQAAPGEYRCTPAGSASCGIIEDSGVKMALTRPAPARRTPQ